MRPNPKHTDDALRKVGRNVVNFQRLEQALKALVRLSSYTDSQSRSGPIFPRQTKRLKRAGLAEAANQFNRAFYDEAVTTKASILSTVVRFSSTFRLEPDANTQSRRKELVALARERNRLIHNDLVSIDFFSESVCVALSERLDAQNLRILDYLEFVRSVRDTQVMMLQELVAFVESDEFLTVGASDEFDA
jgi:hypothetical protein